MYFIEQTAAVHFSLPPTPSLQGQTALFLACREGCASCVKHLLDCFANVTLLDNLDRSPIQIAYEKQHHDIVELLKTSAHGPLVHYPLTSRVHTRMPMYSHGPGMPITGDQEVFVMQRPLSSLVRSKRQAKQPQERSAVTEPGVPYPYPTDIRGHQFHQQQRHELAAGYLGTHATQPTHQTFGELTHQPPFAPHCHPSKIPLQDMHTYSYSSSVNGANPMLPTSSNMTHHPSSSSTSSSSSPPQLLNTPKVHPTVTSGYNSDINYGTSYSNNGSRILLESSHHPTTSAYSSAIQHTQPVSEPMATTSNYTEPTATLSDIETVNELITSMADDLGPVPHHTTATAIDASEDTVLRSVNGSKPYVSQSVDQLQSVGYSMPATTTIVDTTQPSVYPESSGGYTHASGSYHQTVYDCCSQSAPSSALPGTSSYHASTQPNTGSTRPLQHLPIPVDMSDPSLQYAGGINPGTYGHHQNGTTGVGNNSRSPPSYYPSPPSTDLHYGVPPPVGHHHSSIDPPSLTPSPESRDELRQCMDQFTTESYVEGQIQDYPLLHQHQHFVHHRPVPPCESHV